MVDMWSNTLDIIGITIAALMINLRYFLIGTSLDSLFVNSSNKEKFKFMHFVTDECWAITMNRLKYQEIGSSFLFGGGICIFVFWFTGTILGFTLGEFISDPRKYGLDFAFIAIFIALTFGMYKSKEDIVPWLITAFIAVLCEHYMGGKAYIVIAAITGSFFASLLYNKDKIC
jgi:predicted branched-subunit amino acid permease